MMQTLGASQRLEIRRVAGVDEMVASGRLVTLKYMEDRLCINWETNLWILHEDL